MFMCLFAPPFVYIGMYTSLYYKTVEKFEKKKHDEIVEL